MPKGSQYPEYTNSQIRQLIMEYVHSERNRKMVILFYVHDKTYDELCAIFNLSLTQVKRIVSNGGQTVFRHIPYK